MKALIIEDDFLFVDVIRKNLETAVPDLRRAIDVIKTERQFREVFDSTAKLDYGLIVLDIMVQWDALGAGSVPAEDAWQEGYFRAGIRCLDRIRKRPESAITPVIVHSALESSQIIEALSQKRITQNQLEIIPKSGDPAAFIECSRRLLSGSS